MDKENFFFKDLTNIENSLEKLEGMEKPKDFSKKEKQINKTVKNLKQILTKIKSILNKNDNNKENLEKKKSLKLDIKKLFEKNFNDRSFLLNEIQILYETKFLNSENNQIEILDKLTNLQLLIKNSLFEKKNYLINSQNVQKIDETILLLKNLVIKETDKKTHYKDIFYNLIKKHNKITLLLKKNIEKKTKQVFTKIDESFEDAINGEKKELLFKIKLIQKKAYERKLALKEIFKKLENRNLELNNKKKIIKILRISVKEVFNNLKNVNFLFKSKFSSLEKKISVFKNKVFYLRENFKGFQNKFEKFQGVISGNNFDNKISKIQKNSLLIQFEKFNKKVRNSDFLSNEVKTVCILKARTKLIFLIKWKILIKEWKTSLKIIKTINFKKITKTLKILKILKT